MKPNQKNHILAALTAVTLLSQHASAIPIFWDSGTGNWATLAAWTTAAGATTPDPLAIPGANDDLTFNRTGANTNNVITLAADRSARSLTFSSTGTSLFRANASGTTTARSLTIGSVGISVLAGSGVVTIGDTVGTFGAINIALAANQTWTSNATSGTTTIAGIVSGAFNLTKAGTGTIRINGANTFSGALEVTGGVLQIGSYSGLNSPTSITVSGGGTSNLQLVQVGSGATSNSINKPLSLHGILSTAGGGSTNTLAQTMAGAITLAGNSTINNHGNATFILSGGIVLGSNTLTYQADGGISRIDGTISGAGSLNKTGAQVLSLNTANTYTGTTTITAGVLIIGNTGAFGTTPGVDGTSGITMVGGSRLVSSVNGVVINAPITVGAAATTVTISTPSFTGNQILSDGVMTLASAITGDGNVTFNSTVNTNHLNNILLTAQSTYAGSTLITTTSNNGANQAHQVVVRLGIDNALPTTTVLTFDGGTGNGSGRVAEFVMHGYDQTLAGLNNVTRSLRAQRVVNNDTSDTSTLTINGSVDSTYGGTIGVNSPANSMSVSNFPGGTNGNNIILVKNGSGTFALTGSNSFSGKTTVLGGILSLGHISALSQSPLDTTASIVGDATNGLRSTVTSLSLGGLTGNKNFADVFTTTTGGYEGLTGLTLNPVSGATHSYAGDIGDGATAMTLTKTGAGTQVLSGVQSFTGATNVNAGTLRVNGSTHSSSNFTVASVATLGGVGTVAGDVTVSGSIAPGHGVADALELTTGDMTWNASTFKFEIVGAESDKLTINGVLTKGTGGDGAFVFNFTGSSPIADTVHTLLTFDSSVDFSLANFSYTGLPSEFSMSHFTLTPTSLQFSAIPEASNILVGGLLGLGLMSRRRKQA